MTYSLTCRCHPRETQMPKMIIKVLLEGRNVHQISCWP